MTVFERLVLQALRALLMHALALPTPREADIAVDESRLAIGKHLKETK